MAGLDPAIPINSRGRAFLSGIAGTSPAMQLLVRGGVARELLHFQFIQIARQARLVLTTESWR